MDEYERFKQQMADVFRDVAEKVAKYFWLAFLIGTVAGAIHAYYAEPPPPLPSVPPIFWLMIL